MKNKQYPLVIGFGNKARQGKDYAAKYIKEVYSDVIIMHWADALYAEVSREDENNPLAIRIFNTRKQVNEYMIFEKYFKADKSTAIYGHYSIEEVPRLHKIFEDRNIDVYHRMEEKDAEILQFWGTDYRRTFFGGNYWVNIIKKQIEDIDPNAIILIPDTRFLNEYKFIKSINGFFVRVNRWKQDGTQYLATDRDPKHPSEIELDKIKADFTIDCPDKDIDKLRASSLEIFDNIVNIWLDNKKAS